MSPHAPSIIFLLSTFATLTSSLALPQNIKRQATTLLPSYDFIIAGAGTAGLTVADRVSAAFPTKNILVVEPGDYEFATGVFEPPTAPRGATGQSLRGVPMPALNNRTQTLQLGRTVGGSSAINGQFFDRGCRWDFDDWEELMGKEENDSEDTRDRWDWEGIVEWYRKSVTFTEPTEEVREEIGYTWDYEAAYGGEAGVQSSFPPFQWGIQSLAWQTWVEAGVAPRVECAAGDKDGICWVPTSQDPWDGTRSTSRTGHLDPVIDDRDNYHVLVRHKVTRIIYEDDDSPPVVEILPLDAPIAEDEDEEEPAAPEPFLIPSTLETVLSAGAIHTPQILQLSGIGPANILSAAGVDLVHELPGVGYNFHDHGGAGVTYSVNTSGIDVGVSQADMRDSDFMEQAMALYEERPAQGPYTTAMGNSAIYVSFPNITEDFATVTAAIRKQLADGEAATYLPVNAPDAVVKGYEAQLEILAKALENPKYPILETPFSAGFSSLGFLLKPLSRGYVHITSSSQMSEPEIDWATAANPLDLEVLSSFIPFFRRYFEGETFQSSLLDATEIQPGKNVTEKEDLIEYVRRTAQSSFMHPCCTAAMMPEDKGGVVGTDLKVYGLKGLRVVDASVFPVLPGTHTSATVYAVAEKAADIIIREYEE